MTGRGKTGTILIDKLIELSKGTKQEIEGREERI